MNPSSSKHEKPSTFENAQELLDKSNNINLDIGQGTNKRKSDDGIQESDSPDKEIINKRARKVDFLELPSTSSRSTRSKRAVGSALETPKKRSKAKIGAETPTELSLDTCSADISTPDRNRRKQKPKVVFTMLDSPELESIIRSLGGTVVNSVETSTVLVTGNLKRTPKLLSAIGLSKPICSPKWLQECKKACQFLDPWDYVLEDVDAESNWNLSLKESLIKSRTQKLFQNCTVYIAVTNSVDALKAAVESCGGKCVTKAPTRITNQNFVIVANPENKTKYSKFLNRDPPVKVVKPEAILDGVLRQELRFEEYLLS
ncbi:hypothetical protein FQR65_LT07836 [Abscondita terminalis]|nr:hypothetical protein FQR65_LT07836 [Abscondita terminalis]